MFKRILLMMLLGLALSMPLTAAPTSSTYGPVTANETLWSVAAKLNPDPSISVEQTMLALYNYNPHAFNSRNINTLQKGAYLTLPSIDDIKRYNRNATLRDIAQQNRAWRRGLRNHRNPYRPAGLSAGVADPNAKATVAPSSTLVTNNEPSSTELQSKVNELQTQLKQTQQQNAELTAQLKVLQSKPTAPASNENAQIQEQINALRSELTELKTILEQKDNHIKTLQAALKSASEAIKSQHADNMRLYEKLKELSPASVASAKPQASGQAVLKLAEVETQQVPSETVTIPPAVAPANKAETTVTTTVPQASNAQAETGKTATPPAPPGPVSVWMEDGKPTTNTPTEAITPIKPVLGTDSKQASNAVRESSGVPITQMMASPQSITNSTASQPSSRSSISPITWLIALASLLFIISLVWRAHQRQRELQRLEEEEKRIAERMRRRLEELKPVPEKPQTLTKIEPAIHAANESTPPAVETPKADELGRPETKPASA
ncbi:FimV/HubP family polar landmark protein [Thiolinea disciformis]|uniref:FimV/HubP family polar landmark protein n=1 Tax=Thiolinea disciformis TaxID=125614 RepID=UPI0009FEB139|nr:FimV/HubP family polar landmark protein [Thiolinea disciformis]